MFNEYESSGKHMICDFKEIQNIELLNNFYELNLLLKNICQNNDFQILNAVKYKFEPIGCSIIFLLSESHLSIHTFPEKGHHIIVYLCFLYQDSSFEQLF